MNRFLTVFIVAAALVAPASAQSVLLLNEECGGSAELFPTALTNAGLTFTETNDAASFETELTTGGPWDIVIVDEYANFINPTKERPNGRLSQESLTAIQDYIANGGVIYMNYWAWDPATAASFEATLGATYTVPQPILIWEPTFPLLNIPNTVGDMTPTADTCNTDGALFEPTGGGNAIAGYTATPTTGQAAIVVGNAGRTILFGSIIGLFGTDGPAFAENVVQHLVNPVPVELQTFDIE